MAKTLPKTVLWSPSVRGPNPNNCVYLTSLRSKSSFLLPTQTKNQLSYRMPRWCRTTQEHHKLIVPPQLIRLLTTSTWLLLILYRYSKRVKLSSVKRASILLILPSRLLIILLIILNSSTRHLYKSSCKHNLFIINHLCCLLTRIKGLALLILLVITTLMPFVPMAPWGVTYIKTRILILPVRTGVYILISTRWTKASSSLKIASLTSVTERTSTRGTSSSSRLLWATSPQQIPIQTWLSVLTKAKIKVWIVSKISRDPPTKDKWLNPT